MKLSTTPSSPPISTDIYPRGLRAVSASLVLPADFLMDCMFATSLRGDLRTEQNPALIISALFTYVSFYKVFVYSYYPSRCPDSKVYLPLCGIYRGERRTAANPAAEISLLFIGFLLYCD